MTGKRKLTKEDVTLKWQAGAANLVVKGPVDWRPMGAVMESYGYRIVLDETGMVLCFLGMAPNPFSPLQIVIKGNDATITENGQVVATGKLEQRPAWAEELLEDGIQTLGDAFPTNLPTECYIGISSNCYSRDSGRTCRFCGFAADFATGPLGSLEETIAGQTHAARIIARAARNGWRGAVVLGGGLLSPERRGRYYTDLIEATMTQFRKFLDDDGILSELMITVDGSPPDDLGEYYKWKTFGVNSIEIDTEVLDRDWFKAICPAKDKDKWNAGQEAAAEVFGRGRGSSNLFVLGLEPMAGMLEGVEERVSKGVYTMPSVFGAFPNSPMAGMGTPSPEFVSEAIDKIIDIYFKYGDTFDVPFAEDDRWGYTCRHRSLFQYDDEIIRRIQEMGKMPAGIPHQYQVEGAAAG